MSVDHLSIPTLIFLLLLLGPLFYYIRKAKQKKDIFLRRIPGIDAINETIGQSVERGKPIFFSTGMTGISPLLYACLSVVQHVVRKNAVFKNGFFIPQNNPEVLAITEDYVESAYQDVGRSEYFSHDQLIYLSDEQFAYAAGYIGMVKRENAGAAFLFGHFAAESLILAEAGYQAGAKQVAATTTPEQIPFFIVACDYTLIGEELFAAGAYLSRDPVQVGSLIAQDVGKFIVILMIILGVLFATIESLSPGLLPFNFVEVIS